MPALLVEQYKESMLTEAIIPTIIYMKRGSHGHRRYQARFLRCIGEPSRLRILKLLASGDKCVGEIVEVLNKEQSLVSHHLRALKECNIVAAKQEV